MIGTETQTTTAAEDNVAIILRAYEAFARGDIATVFQLLADDITWHVPGRGPLSGDFHGHAEVMGFFQHFMGLSQGTFRIAIDDVLAKGDRVIALVTESAQHDGRAWSSPQVHAWTVKDGRARAFWQFQGDQQTEDEFWADAEKAQPH